MISKNRSKSMTSVCARHQQINTFQHTQRSKSPIVLLNVTTKDDSVINTKDDSVINTTTTTTTAIPTPVITSVTTALAATASVANTSKTTATTTNDCIEYCARLSSYRTDSTNDDYFQDEKDKHYESIIKSIAPVSSLSDESANKSSCASSDGDNGDSFNDTSKSFNRLSMLKQKAIDDNIKQQQPSCSSSSSSFAASSTSLACGKKPLTKRHLELTVHKYRLPYSLCVKKDVTTARQMVMTACKHINNVRNIDLMEWGEAVLLSLIDINLCDEFETLTWRQVNDLSKSSCWGLVVCKTIRTYISVLETVRTIFTKNRERKRAHYKNKKAIMILLDGDTMFITVPFVNSALINLYTDNIMKNQGIE